MHVIDAQSQGSHATRSLRAHPPDSSRTPVDGSRSTMGVTGLWTVLQPCARPIKIETLNKRRLAVDASIWIYQFLKAVRDKEGNALRNSHIVGFFRRVCKLLFIGIKPVFVFDGGAPALKRQTISHRKSRREGKRDDAVRTAGKLLAIQMQKAAEEEGRRRKEAAQHPRAEQEEEVPDNLVYAEELLQTQEERTENRKFKKKDQYHLPDLGASMQEMGGANDPRVMSLEDLEEYARQFDRGEDINVYDFSKIDFDGMFFQSLPAADRYNILNAARLRSRLRMGYSKDQLDSMFPDRMAFSKFQIERVRERNDLTTRLMNLNGMNDDSMFGTNRVAGEKGREYVLVKNDGVEGGWALGVVTNKEEGKAHKPIDVDLPQHAAQVAEEWEDDEDFEDVPIEGLNRLPKAKPGPSREEQEGREFISKELSRRRQKLYESRKRRPVQTGPRRAAPVNQDPDSLFLAEDDDEERWENVATNGGMDSFEEPGDDAEEEQLQQAIAMSLQQNGQEEAGEESEEDPVREVFRQERVQESNPFKSAKGSGMAIGRLANQYSSKPAPKGPFEGSDSEDDMDLQAALAESRQSRRATKPQQQSNPPPSAPLPAVEAQPKPVTSHGFDGPLPFERLNLGNSLLGKKKMQKIEADTAGGFEKTQTRENIAAPLPPWFKGERDIAKDLTSQREEEKQEWEKAREDEKQFQFQQLPRLRKHESKEVIDLDVEPSQKASQVIALESDDEDIEMEDVLISGTHNAAPIEEPQLTMGDLANKVRADPPRPLSDGQKTPPPQDLKLVKKTPFVEESDEEQVEWSESEAEDESRATAMHVAAEKVLQPEKSRTASPSKSPSPEFEDVPMNTGSTVAEPQKSPSLEFEDVPMHVEPTPASQPPKSPSPEFEDVPIRTERHRRPRRESSPAVLEGPDDLEIPIVPYSGIADDNALLIPDNDSDQYSDPEDEELFASLAAEGEEHARFAQELNNNNTARINFDEELKQLRNQQKKDRRDADEVTQTMISECQHLLTLFGLPYVTAPMEAEAQCAELVTLGLVDGIVTDDSDTFLFGGTRVYKNMFNAAKFVECYLSQDLTTEFSLTREKLIAIAQLLGSDYTTGIPGIGPVTALEILAEFPNLNDFKDWWTGVQNNSIPKSADASSPFRRRFRRSQGTKLFLPPSFPDPRVEEAYLQPEVDSDPEPFQWGVPDLAALRSFLNSQIGWSWERTDEVLVPVIKDMNRREQEGTQANITRFFEGSVGAGAFAPRVRGQQGGLSGKKRGKGAAGKRLGAALTKLAAREGARGGADEEDDEGEEGAAEDAPATNIEERGKRKAVDNAIPAAADDGDEDEDDDGAYEEPKKKKPKRARKAKVST
jgi:DNA excision repair protein ERCC-5